MKSLVELSSVAYATMLKHPGAKVLMLSDNMVNDFAVIELLEAGLITCGGRVATPDTHNNPFVWAHTAERFPQIIAEISAYDEETECLHIKVSHTTTPSFWQTTVVNFSQDEPTIERSIGRYGTHDARIEHYDEDTRVFSIRCNACKNPPFWLTLRVNLNKVERWISLSKQ